MADLRTINELCRLLSDPTRVRLLALLASEALTIAELTQLTGLAQSRVSTHLAKLRDAGLLQVRREGALTFHETTTEGGPSAQFWGLIQGELDDSVLDEDRAHARKLVAARQAQWADSVAGHMERHYSPGRTWESTARAFAGLARLGDVLDLASGDGVLAELIAPRAAQITCLDQSTPVVEAAQKRLGHLKNVRFVVGDMHLLPFDATVFDQVLLMSALTYAQRPQEVLRESYRVLRPGGGLVAVTLEAHPHAEIVQPYGHLQLGFSLDQLTEWLTQAGFWVELAQVTHQERRAPNFKVITLHARKPELKICLS